jgi:hypothetical protein
MSAKVMQMSPQHKLGDSLKQHAQVRPVGIVRPMIAQEKRGRDTSPAIRLRQPRIETLALQQQQQHQSKFPPPPATQQQLMQMGRGERDCLNPNVINFTSLSAFVNSMSTYDLSQYVYF